MAYIGLFFDKESASYLYNLCKKLNVPNMINKELYHVTLLSSTDKIPYQLKDKKVNYKATIKNLKILKTKNNTNCLVLILDSKEICEKERYIYQIYNILNTSTYKYFPHITLSYDIGDMDINKIKLNKIIISKELTLDLQYHDQLTFTNEPTKISINKFRKREYN